MGEYEVDGIKFSNKEQAERASQELNFIKNIKEKYNINDKSVATNLLEKCVNSFTTVIGYDFLDELRSIVENDDKIKDVYKISNGKNQDKENNVYNNKKIKSYNIFYILSVTFFIISILNFYFGFDKKNNYYNPDSLLFDTVNAYVGADAYNYIINASYFTGYMVIAGTFLICAILFLLVGFIVKQKYKF